MPWLVAAILALGILPSLTAPSQALVLAFPRLQSYLGPVNALKLGAPVLLAWVWLRRAELPRAWLPYAGALGVGTVATVIAGVPCGFPQPLVREWAVMLLGSLAALSFLVLPRRQAFFVLGAWAVAIFGGALLDGLAPDATAWLNQNVFDPGAASAYDQTTTGFPLLHGLFGNQSLAKFLAWTPWLLLAFAFRWELPRGLLWALVGLAVVSNGAILMTSQRGPFLGAAAGWCVLAAHQAIRAGNRRAALAALGALVLSCGVMLAIVPWGLLRARALGTFSHDTNQYEHAALWTRDFRIQTNRLSWDSIKTHPLGDACIPAETFHQYGVFPAHAHSLFLHQFRERGWIWGALHLGLWLWAFVAAWRTRSPYGSMLAAGIATIAVLGLFDHPWFVLNHAMVLSLFILLGISTPDTTRRTA
jgi:hypothetical protein